MILITLMDVCTCMRAFARAQTYYHHECWVTLLAEVEMIKGRMKEKVRNCSKLISVRASGNIVIGPVLFVSGGEAVDCKCSTKRRPGGDRKPNPEI